MLVELCYVTLLELHYSSGIVMEQNYIILCHMTLVNKIMLC